MMDSFAVGYFLFSFVSLGVQFKIKCLNFVIKRDPTIKSVGACSVSKALFKVR